MTPYFIAGAFSFATATSKDIQTVLIMRFFCRSFESAPIANTRGVLGDIWTAKQRGMAIVAYVIAVVSFSTYFGSLPSINLPNGWIN